MSEFYIGLTEYAVFNHPPGMEDWRLYRISYGGFNEATLAEGTVWLPENADPYEFGRMLKALAEGEEYEIQSIAR